MAGEEITLVELPFEIVKNSAGFSVDMGGSVAKVIYRDKRDWDFEKNEPRKINGRLAQVRSCMFAREKRKDVINYIKEHCHFTPKTGSKTLLYTTGIGGHEYGKEFGSAFNVTPKNRAESDCFVKAFRYLCNNLPEHKFLHEVPARPFEKFRVQVEQLQSFVEKTEASNFTAGKMEMQNQSKAEQMKAAAAPKSQNLSKGDADSYAKQNQVFPCLVAMLGSGIGFMQVDEDGAFAIKEISNRGGRSFLGLGSILTGATSYEELIKMAEKGDQKKVHTYTEDFDVHRSEGAEDLYANSPSDFLVFCFGKGVGKSIGDFTKEDLARSWLHHMCNDIAQITQLTMKSHDLKTVFVCGGFGNSALVRELLTEEFLLSSLLAGKVGQGEIRFVKGGSYLGAIGAYLEEYQF